MVCANTGSLLGHDALQPVCRKAQRGPAGQTVVQVLAELMSRCGKCMKDVVTHEPHMHPASPARACTEAAVSMSVL